MVCESRFESRFVGEDEGSLEAEERKLGVEAEVGNATVGMAEEELLCGVRTLGLGETLRDDCEEGWEDGAEVERRPLEEG